MKLKNNAKGPRMIQMIDDEPAVLLMPGETKSVDASKILHGLPSGVAEDREGGAEPRSASKAAKAAPSGPVAHDDEDELDPAPPELAEKATDKPQLDHDGDGKAGGSKPHDPPALSGMQRDELEAQAKKEGIDLDQVKGTGKGGNVLMGDIIKAIETKRGAE